MQKSHGKGGEIDSVIVPGGGLVTNLEVFSCITIKSIVVVNSNSHRRICRIKFTIKGKDGADYFLESGNHSGQGISPTGGSVNSDFRKVVFSDKSGFKTLNLYTDLNDDSEIDALSVVGSDGNIIEADGESVTIDPVDFDGSVKILAPDQLDGQLQKMTFKTNDYGVIGIRMDWSDGSSQSVKSEKLTHGRIHTYETGIGESFYRLDSYTCKRGNVELQICWVEVFIRKDGEVIPDGIKMGVNISEDKWNEYHVKKHEVVIDGLPVFQVKKADDYTETIVSIGG